MSKRSRFIIFTVIFSSLLIGALVSGSSAYADGLSIEAIAIEGDTQITLVGTTDKIDQDITVVVTAPNGNIVTIAQITPETNGDVNSVINVGGSLWKQDGIYSINAQQLDNHLYNVTMEVEVQDGAVIPEFGTIAAMILAVSVISIIAITAKTKITPRF